MSEHRPVPMGRRLTDPDTGQAVELIYASPAVPADVAQADNGGSVELSAVLRCLWNRRWLVLACVVASAVAGGFFAMTRRDEFTASVTTLPPANKSGAGALAQYADLASLAGIAIPQTSGNATEEILALLNSRTLHQRLVERFALTPYYGKTLLQEAERAFAKDFKVVNDKKASTITFAFTHEDPQMAKDVASAATDLLREMYNNNHQSSSRREREFLEKRLVEIDLNLTAAQQKLAVFQRESHTIQLESQIKATVEAISSLQGQLIGQQVEMRALLASSASADNPAIRLLQERINGLTEAINRLVGIPTAGSTSGEPAGNMLLMLGNLPELGIRYFNLYREVKKNEVIVQSLIGQLETARINELRSAEVITVIDAAEVPQRRSGPLRSLICSLSAVIGLVLGIFAALASDRLAASHSTGATPTEDPAPGPELGA